MQLVEVGAENFLPFENITLPLVNQGLVCILGENKESGVASSNGAGKSSIFELIYFSLTGRTLRKILLKDVIRRGAGYCFTWCSFVKDERHYRIERYRNHSVHGNNIYFTDTTSEDVKSLNEDSNDKTQQLIFEVLGFDADQFKTLFLFGSRGRRRFSDMNDRERKELVEDILRLDVWSKAFLKVKAEATVLGEKKKRIERELETSSRLLSSYLSMINKQKESLEKEEASVYEEIRGIEEKISALELSLMQLKSREEKDNLQGETLDSLKENIANATCEIRELELKRADLTLKIDKIHSRGSNRRLEIERNVGYAKQAVKTSRRQLDELRDNRKQQEGKTCPTCKQHLSCEDLDKLIKKEEEKFAIADERASKAFEDSENFEKIYSETLQKANNELALCMKQIQECSEKLERLKKKLTRNDLFEARKAQILSEEKIYRDLLKSSCQKYDRLSSVFDVSAIESQVQEQENEKKRLEKEQVSVLKECDILDELLILFGPKGLRSLIFERSLPEINQRLSHYSRLMSEGWLDVSLSSQTQTSKKNVKEEISVKVRSHGVEVPYESCSEGEQRRLDLPLFFAIQDFAFACGLTLGITLLDEVFENVDEKGTDSLFFLLDEVSTRKHSQTVFVITHSADVASRFSRVLSVVKERGCSFLEA